MSSGLSPTFLDMGHPDQFRREVEVRLRRWRVRPLFAMALGSNTYGWNLIDPRGFVRDVLVATVDEVGDAARRRIGDFRPVP